MGNDQSEICIEISEKKKKKLLYIMLKFKSEWNENVQLCCYYSICAESFIEKSSMVIEYFFHYSFYSKNID